MDNYVEIWAHCYSEKENVSISFGISVDASVSIDEFNDTEWIDEGMSDSFWENYYEFEPGIEKANALLDNNPSLTLKEALFNVFGHFSISYEMDGKEIKLNFDINADEGMYYLLEN